MSSSGFGCTIVLGKTRLLLVSVSFFLFNKFLIYIFVVFLLLYFLLFSVEWREQLRVCCCFCLFLCFFFVKFTYSATTQNWNRVETDHPVADREREEKENQEIMARTTLCLQYVCMCLCECVKVICVFFFRLLNRYGCAHICKNIYLFYHFIC